MNDQEVCKFLKKQRYEAHFYPYELFERRIREERFRATELKTSFCSIEIPYAELTHQDASEELQTKSWKLLLESLPQCLRGSDVRGFLPGGKGLGILLLDCPKDATHTFLHRLRQKFVECGLDIALKNFHDLAQKSTFFSGRNDD